MTKLYVGNLPYTVTDQQLNSLFATFGIVLSVALINDKFTGQSKGFGFVEMEDDAAAQQAIQELNNSEYEGRKIFVSVARPREERPQGGGDFNRGGGDFNRGGGGFSRGGRDSRGGGRR